MSTVTHWGTHFYVGKVEDHEKILSSMLPYLNDPNNFLEPWVYSKCKSTCQHPNNKNLPWHVFFEAVRPNIEEYFDKLDPMIPYTVNCDEIWMNIYEEGGYQEIHDHSFPNRSFALAYILEMPNEENVGGQLIFENTNFPIVQSTGINRIFSAFNYEKFIPELEEGTLVVFPSWIKHYVLPNQSKQRRASISANIIITANYE
jgi:hypothetical protein